MRGKSILLAQTIKTVSTYTLFFSTKRAYCSIIWFDERGKGVKNRG